MKRRDLLLASTSLLVPALGRSQTPCPPSSLTVVGGSSQSAATCSAATSYSTDFLGNETPLSEGGKWIDGKSEGLDWNNVQSAAGKAYASILSGATGNRYDDSIAHLDPAFLACNANQYAQGTVYRAAGYSPTSGHEIELLLRFEITPHDAHGYEVLWGISGYIALVKWNGASGSYNAIYDPGPGSIPAPNDGDVLRAEISGNSLVVKRNGSIVSGFPRDISGTGLSTWDSGQPGIGFWPVDSATPANYGWKHYEGGNL